MKMESEYLCCLEKKASKVSYNIIIIMKIKNLKRLWVKTKIEVQPRVGLVSH